MRKIKLSLRGDSTIPLLLALFFLGIGILVAAERFSPAVRAFMGGRGEYAPESEVARWFVVAILLLGGLFIGFLGTVRIDKN